MRTVIRNEKFLHIKIVPVFSAENRRFFVADRKRNLFLNDVQEKEQTDKDEF